MQKQTITDLLSIMKQLCDDENGCAWCLEQDYKSLKKYSIEEAYEVCDAIDNGDIHELRDELGDLLFQIVFFAELARKQKHFDFDDVTNAICEKMIRRNPHIFTDNKTKNVDDILIKWEQVKDQEKQKTSAMDDIAACLPALMKTQKIHQRAHKDGFVRSSLEMAHDKILEEIKELQVEVEANDRTKMVEEYGDLLLSVAWYGDRLGINPEEALTQANNKFERRYRHMEQSIKNDNSKMKSLDIEEIISYWDKAKKAKAS